MNKFLSQLPALAFFIVVNQYFGWHSYPQSPEELICDGITLLLAMGGFLMVKVNANNGKADR